MTDFLPEFLISEHGVGGDSKCLVIAEAGVNHFGSLEKAKKLVDLAVEAKADIFKIQHFNIDKLVSIESLEWRDRLRSKEISNDLVVEIKNYCDKKAITFLCTPHDEDALNFLDYELKIPAFKIGSGELENWPYIANIAKRNKPIIFSTGMYSIDKIIKASKIISESGNKSLAILHCVTCYPSPPNIINLHFINSIKKVFSGPVGYSDHTEGTAIPLAAVALGAKVLEKHITLDRDVPNAQDWRVSCDQTNFINFVRDIRSIESALGSGEKTISSEENASMLWARKSLAANRQIRMGDVICSDMVTAMRPGTGLSPENIHLILGKTAKRDINLGELIRTSDLFNG